MGATVEATAHSLRVTWATCDGDAASELIDKFEVAYRPYLALASGSPVGWRSPIVDVARGGRRSALVASLEPDAAFEFKCRARNNVGWSAWSPARQFRRVRVAARAAGRARGRRAAGEAIALWWREPARTFGSPVRTYVLRARADGPPADGEDESDGGLCDDAPLDGMRRDGGWRVLYAGPLTRFLACGLEPGTNYAFAVAAVNGVGASEFDAGVQDAVAGQRGRRLRGAGERGAPAPGRHVARVLGPRPEAVFYFHRLTARRERTAPPEFVELRNESNERRQLGLLSDEDVRADAASQFRRRVPASDKGQRCLVVLRRSHLRGDSLDALRCLPAPELNKRFKIEYDGENGIDSGGLTKDWYLALSHGFADVNFGFFSKTPAGDLELKPSDEQGGRPVDDFKALGRFLAKAVFDQHDRPFYRSLRWILDNDLGDDGGGLDATFSVQRGDVEVDLKERGRSVAVVERNKHEYVFLVARWRARHATAMEMDALLDGAAEVGVVPDLLRRFSLEELDLLMMHEFDDDMRARALAFATGSNKIPLDGFLRRSRSRSTPARGRAPVVHTCFNQIVLSNFTSYATMKKQCAFAIRNCATFELS
ncbi:ubiquitin protein ligase [Aureococcus anophagefferens]|nr:ubiquitin protein ligase [Aureococcus anophagefferens]